MEWPLFSSQKSSTYLGNVQVAPECSRLCVQHNDKFLQRQDYWRDTAPAAIDRTAVAKVDAHGVLLKSCDHHLGCIKHWKCWDKLSLTRQISEASTEGHLWLGGMLHNVAHPSQRKTTSTRKQESCFFFRQLLWRTVNFLLKGVIIADTLEEATWQRIAAMVWWFRSSR